MKNYMKTIYNLREVTDLDLTVFGINSHVKDYNLCWHINKTLDLGLKKNKGAITNQKEIFSSFEFMLEEQKILLLQNLSLINI